MGEHGRSVVRAVLLCPGQGAQKVGMGRDGDAFALAWLGLAIVGARPPLEFFVF